jgi:hypothetical protein
VDSAAIAQESASATIAPAISIDILESILREQLGDQRAVVMDCTCAPLSHEGTNDSTALFRVTFSWSRLNRSLSTHTTTWIMKRWRAGGARDTTRGIAEPREALAWRQGWLRQAGLPAGVITPIIGAWHSPDRSEAWLAMEDVSVELSAYSRFGLSGDEALSRARAILARLARFHAMWEQPERQAELQQCSWLRRPDEYLWDLAPTYAQALGSPPSQTPSGASAPPAWEGLSADLNAFLSARPADERRVWEGLLIDRRSLESLAGYPPTLIHNDLDDRNIGLRWPDGKARATTPDLPGLVLIDWEWMALGPAAIDAATTILRLPIMITPGTPIPGAIWTDELVDYYYAHYREAGGACTNVVSWRRSYGLAYIAQALTQMPFVHGRMLRAIYGEIPPPQIVGVPDEIIRQNLRASLPMMRQMEERVMYEAYGWLR